MASCHTTITTHHASKYLQQLCKHFAHKVEVTYDAFDGHAKLPYGPCNMKATASELYIECNADGMEGLSLSCSVIERHLEKFAWREKLTVAWQDCPEGDGILGTNYV